MYLKSYKKSYDHKKGLLCRSCWYLINILIFKSNLPIPSRIKIYILKIFGTQVGKGVVLKPNINIKYPWLLILGDDIWIGENVWLDNLDIIEIQSNVCISQNCYLTTGSHDFSKDTFDLKTFPILIKKHSWICCNSVVLPNVIIGESVLVKAGSIVHKSIPDKKNYSSHTYKIS